MIPSIIFAFSFGALVQFALSYCRTLLLTYGEVELSDRVREIVDITPQSCRPYDFERLLQLVRFAPQTEDDASQMRAIKAYYRVTRFASKAMAPISREASEWLQTELSRCTHFAAVALDRRLAGAEK
jgi:hypothetical protein